MRGSSWQAIDSGQLLLVVAAGTLVAAAIAQMATVGMVETRDAFAFGALVAFGELLRLNLPGNRESAPIATAGALAYALLLRVGDRPAMPSAPQVIAITAIGMTVGVLPHVAVGRPAGLAAMASRLLAVACVAFVFRPLARSPVIENHWWLALAVMTLLVAVAWLADALICALIRADELRSRFGVALRDELRVQLPLGVAVSASAVFIAFAAEVMGLAAVAVFMAPLLVTQVAYRRYAGIRATYLQTVRARARVTEVGGYVENGHSYRVSSLAVAIGRDLGMTEPQLLELEYAALMHDIGQLSLQDPIPGGATVLVSPDDQRRIAELGAEVIEQAGILGQVADIVRRQSEPYNQGGLSTSSGGRCSAPPQTAPAGHSQGGRRSAPPQGRGADPGPPLGSRIIRAGNAFDDLVGSSTDSDRGAAALERLRLDTATEYDPRVVEALSKVVSRRTVSRR